MWATTWRQIDRFLTSSAPRDGWKYTAKIWTMTHVTEPVLELAYLCGIRSYKPVCLLKAEDLV